MSSIKQTLKNHAGGVIQDEILDHMAREIQKEMDDGIMSSMLVDQGWTKTNIDCHFLNAELIATTAEWIHLNAQGNYKLLNGYWLFERAEDATLFTLKFTNG